MLNRLSPPAAAFRTLDLVIELEDGLPVALDTFWDVLPLLRLQEEGRGQVASGPAYSSGLGKVKWARQKSSRCNVDGTCLPQQPHRSMRWRELKSPAQ